MIMTREEFQELLDEQNECIKCEEADGLLVVINNLIINKPFSKPLPSNLVRIGGSVRGELHPQPQLQSIGGSVRGELHPQPQLQSIGGGVRGEAILHPQPQLQSIGGGLGG